MFFDCERTGVELRAKNCHVGNVACPGLANRGAHKLRYELFIGDTTQHKVKASAWRQVMMGHGQRVRTGNDLYQTYVPVHSQKIAPTTNEQNKLYIGNCKEE